MLNPEVYNGKKMQEVRQCGLGRQSEIKLQCCDQLVEKIEQGDE